MLVNRGTFLKVRPILNFRQISCTADATQYPCLPSANKVLVANEIIVFSPT